MSTAVPIVIPGRRYRSVKTGRVAWVVRVGRDGVTYAYESENVTARKMTVSIARFVAAFRLVDDRPVADAGPLTPGSGKGVVAS